MSNFLSRLLSSLLPSTQVEEHTIHGFQVLVDNTRPDIQTPAVLHRLEESLELIDQYQPWRLRHMRRDLNGFVVMRYACRGAFFPADRVCMTELTFLARTDISAAPVAASILHEGMHARVHAMGVNAASRDRAREERICRRAELDFGLSLPASLGAPVVERAVLLAAHDPRVRDAVRLADGDVAPTIDWAEAKRRQDAIDAEARRR